MSAQRFGSHIIRLPVSSAVIEITAPRDIGSLRVLRGAISWFKFSVKTARQQAGLIQ